MDTLVYSLLGMIVGLVILFIALTVIVWLIDRHSERQHTERLRGKHPDHIRMCTHYNRCPECRGSVQEPLSNLDRWDRLR